MDWADMRHFDPTSLKKKKLDEMNNPQNLPISSGCQPTQTDLFWPKQPKF